MAVKIAPIVEGHGEVEAVPILLRRLAAEIAEGEQIDILHPIRVSRSRLIKAGELERAVTLAALRTRREDWILILIDGDDDCPAKMGPALLERSRRVRPDRRTSVVIARSEYEAWFLASAESIAGQRGLAKPLDPPQCPESIRDAKGWLSSRMAGAASYRPTVDQPGLTAVFDLRLARRAPSFDKLWREVKEVLGGQGVP